MTERIFISPPLTTPIKQRQNKQAQAFLSKPSPITPNPLLRIQSVPRPYVAQLLYNHNPLSFHAIVPTYHPSQSTPIT